MKKMYAADYRQLAAEKVAPFAGLLALITLVYSTIIGAVSGISSIGSQITNIIDVMSSQGTSLDSTTSYVLMGSSLALTIIGTAAEIILTPFFYMAVYNICEKLSNNEPIRFVDVFSGFKGSTWKFVLVSFVTGLYTALWALLFIIPGIIKSYSYAMVPYIYREHREWGPNDCIDESRRLMDGHKWELFCLDISYIGWILLCVLTLGVLTLWVTPRMEQARYEFYRHITGKDEEVVSEEFVEQQIEE